MRVIITIYTVVVMMTFVLTPLNAKGNGSDNTVYFNIDRAVEVSIKNDFKLGKLKTSLRELLRSKVNLYRGILPKIKTSFSRSKSILVGEADTLNYNFGFTLEQVLYDQLSTPVKIREYHNSIDKLRLQIYQREKEVEAQVIDLYMSLIYGKRVLSNAKKKIEMYDKLVELTDIEYEIGSKTIIDVIEAEKSLLEAKLAREEVLQNRDIAYRNLIDILNIKEKGVNVVLDCNTKDIYKRVFKHSGVISLNTLVYVLNGIQGINRISEHRDILYKDAIENSFDIKVLKLQLKNNSLQRKIVNLSWLKNISANCGINFIGDKFFPVNQTYTLGFDILFDFGFLSPEVSVVSSRQAGAKSLTQTTESDVFDRVAIVGKKEMLNINAHNLKKRIENQKKKIKHDIDVWFIKVNALMNKYQIYQKQKQIISKNEKILLLKRNIGEVKNIEYLKFLIEKENFELKMDELDRDFVNLAREFESIMNIGMDEYERLVNSLK